MKTVEVLTRQTLLDLALQEYGSIEGILDLMERNNIQSVSDELVPGTLLKVGAPVDKEVLAFLKRNNIKPAGALEEESLQYELQNNL